MGTYIEWLSIVNPSMPARRRVPKRQIKTWSQMYIDQNLKIIEDCARLVNTTKTPDVFFSRFDLLLDLLHKFVVLDKYVSRGYFHGMNTHTQYADVLATKEQATNNFINRYWEAAVSKVQNLKTTSAKKNTFDAFFEIMYSYSSKMTPANLSLIQSKETEINQKGYLSEE